MTVTGKVTGLAALAPTPRVRVVDEAVVPVDPEEEQVTDAAQMMGIIDEELEKLRVSDADAARMRDHRRMVVPNAARFDVRAVTGPPEGQPVTVRNFRAQVNAAVFGGIQTGSLRSVCMNQQGTGNWQVLAWEVQPATRGHIPVYVQFVDAVNGKVVEYDAFGVPKSAEARQAMDPELVGALTRAAAAMEKSAAHGGTDDETAALRKEIAELRAKLAAARPPDLRTAEGRAWKAATQPADLPPKE